MNISFSTSDSPTTRTGKVARLPKLIRDRLNQQLRDNVPGTDLVRWLNLMPEVQRLLIQQFHGRAITPQNLSEWKLGGYQDWLMHEERRDWARRLDDEAQDLHTDSSSQPLMENIASMFEVALGQAVMRFVGRPVETMEDLKPLLELSREVAKHRRLAAVSAKERHAQMEHLKQMGPVMARVRKAKSLAMRELMQSMAQGTQEKQLTKRLTAEQKELYAAEMQALTDRYYYGEYGPKGPGYAVGWEEVWKEIEEVMVEWDVGEDSESEDAVSEDAETRREGEEDESDDEMAEENPGESDRIGVGETGAVDGGLRSLTVVDGGFQKGSPSGEDAERGDTETRREGEEDESAEEDYEEDPGESDLIGVEGEPGAVDGGLQSLTVVDGGFQKDGRSWEDVVSPDTLKREQRTLDAGLCEMAGDRILANAPTGGGSEPCILANAPTSEGDPSGSDLIRVVEEEAIAEGLSATEVARRKRQALDLLKI